MSCDGKYANLVSDTYPDHVKMTGITGTNDQVPVPAPGYSSPITLAPVKAAQITTIDAALGVAVNGVPIYDYTSQGMNDVNTYDPKADTKLTGELDQCNGHAGRGDDYHYHASPICMIAAMKNAGPAAILGWGFAPWSGGPLSLIDTVGVAEFVRACDRLAQTYGPRFAPNPLLRKMAEKGETFYRSASKAA